jgi:hypothetical protein
LAWTGLDELATQPANQMLVQLGPSLDGKKPDEVFLVFGHAVPPLSGDLASPPDVPPEMAIRALARFSLSRDRLEGLIRILLDAQQKYDAAASTGETA